jgi:7,8-dihydroneopterin aldolase/epimerase/oxygenase
MSQTDALHITALNVATQIGVHAWEQRIKQTLLIDIIIPSDFSACDEDLSKTIDYDALCKLVTQYVESKSFQLIETVANKVAELIQETFKVTVLTVKVSKPHAVKNAGMIQVVVCRALN